MKTKMKEWSSPFNEFNSMKALLWNNQWQQIVKGNFPPPLGIDTDPSNLCNFNCIWCNSAGFRRQSPEKMPSGHLLKLADFYKEWGVKSTCIAGGGEPLLNPDFSAFLYRLKKNGIESGIITNGSLMTRKHMKAIVTCSRWCGFSVDAGTKEIYSKVHGLKDNGKTFEKVLRNIKALTKLKAKLSSDLEVTFKYLLHPLNAETILKAAKTARSIGVNTFHLRPVCTDNLYGLNREPIDFTDCLDIIDKQMEQALKLETETFKFYGVRHKFKNDFSRKVAFKKCLATPLMSTFGADGNVHLCFDLRGKPDWILCSHYPDPAEVLKVWGGERHKRMIAEIDPSKCPRCTFGSYNEIIEKVIVEDRMYKNFP